MIHIPTAFSRMVQMTTQTQVLTGYGFRQQFSFCPGARLCGLCDPQHKSVL